jgi:hypothetical protein
LECKLRLAAKAGGCPASFKFELEIYPMRFISTRVHGVLDYLTAGVLIAAPSMLGFRQHGTQRWLPLALGVGTIGYSLLTDYELGPFKVIPMPMHLALDAANGALLAASPWLFGFAEETLAPHLGLGLFEILVTASSQSTSSRGAAPGTPSSI